MWNFYYIGIRQKKHEQTQPYKAATDLKVGQSSELSRAAQFKPSRKLMKKPVAPEIILGMGSANERRRYIVTASLIGWAHTQNDRWAAFPQYDNNK